ncbi:MULTISPECIES: rhomboid family intramembrane serine protease [unclassified Gemella]|uniref:rhomboid family intramembrane serine protease n=1 Tax=unclassified Gemella TaxID=2624949 RepID=UPI0010731FCD|nr:MULTISPECIES: rhomboid family intramembrane serine protease [unclassified Gemella]MBF0709710.1 rhomboid family intramembrane serine protease [Gemella sp. GL1.1]MBF0746872.1 rhomboid family intramembrane serine protease [Gemella sp. 19428wG2_WT2a]NYS27054.1 rhomboid family intramembrane serine protease [Gemella sp. GL1]TFU59102.1 rhomboid family intramembrane serine protease [Gemella sp. WT2a]
MGKNFPFATIVFACGSIIWFMYMMFVYGTTTNSKILYLNGAIYGAEFTIVEWWRLITPLFVHIGLDHLLSNMLLLITVGRVLETLIGSFKFTMLYLLSGVAGNLAVVFYDPNTITAGASSALFGVLGLLATHAIFKISPYITYFGKSSFGIIIINLIYTFVVPGISVAGHIGGFIAGIILGLFITEKNSVK